MIQKRISLASFLPNQGGKSKKAQAVNNRTMSTKARRQRLRGLQALQQTT